MRGIQMKKKILFYIINGMFFYEFDYSVTLCICPFSHVLDLVNVHGSLHNIICDWCILLVPKVLKCSLKHL